MCNSNKVALEDNEIVGRYIRDPGSFKSSRRKHKAKNPTSTPDLNDVIPYRLFRPRNGESVTSVIRECFGPSAVCKHAKQIDGVIGIAELKVRDIRNVKICNVQTAQCYPAFEALSDPLNNFPEHAILTTPHISNKLFPAQKGENMNPALQSQLTNLYEDLFKYCIKHPPLTIDQWYLIHTA